MEWTRLWLSLGAIADDFPYNLAKKTQQLLASRIVELPLPYHGPRSNVQRAPRARLEGLA